MPRKTTINFHFPSISFRKIVLDFKVSLFPDSTISGPIKVLKKFHFYQVLRERMSQRIQFSYTKKGIDFNPCKNICLDQNSEQSERIRSEQREVNVETKLHTLCTSTLKLTNLLIWANFTNGNKNCKAYWSLLRRLSNNKRVSLIPSSFHEKKFVTNFKEKAEFFYSHLATQCSLTLFRMGLFRSAYVWMGAGGGGVKRPPSLKYVTLMLQCYND